MACLAQVVEYVAVEGAKGIYNLRSREDTYSKRFDNLGNSSRQQARRR